MVPEGFRRVQEVSEGQNKTPKTETTLKQRVGSLYARPKPWQLRLCGAYWCMAYGGGAGTKRHL